jgi:diguanylate cyclase (GGDEF)-like protein
VLIAALAVLVLGLIWGMTLNLIAVERTAVQHAAVLSTREQTETYEAQVLRAVREIDQALKVVKFAHESRPERNTLQTLDAKGLLPTNLLFIVSIADREGKVVSSTRPAATARIVNPKDFALQRQDDSLWVGRPSKAAGTGDWQLQFSRRLAAADGSFDGVVLIEFDASYFVSAYETSRLGEHGMLGVLGTDGIMRVRRSGDVVSAGDVVAFSSVVPAEGARSAATTVTVNPWDGVRRYTSVQPLYEYPLAVIVGLSEDEQLAASRRNMRTYLWRAGVGSVALILVAAWLRRLSTQLALSRQRVADEQLEHAERVEYLAYHDSLTGLPNRSLFSRLLGQSIHQAHRHDRRLAVMFLDLDRFKQVNDTLGHEAGDQLLQEVAIRLKDCLRDSDTVARLGGDEFVVLLPELDEQMYAATVAQKILSATARPFLLLGQEFRVTASIGISTYPQDGLDEQTLTKNADVAMYKAKEEGKNNFQFYSEKLNAHSLERLTLESGLRHALNLGEFQLHYQAKRDTRSGHISGMEALLRWQHPDLGTIAPMQFIPIAEEPGLILPIGKWVVTTACLQNVAWQRKGLPSMTMAVNLTARQFFDEGLLPTLASILAETGMDAHLLELEIHESLLMRNVEQTLKILTGLKHMGIRIAVDDFGIGYSSLSALRQFPLDTIKIDRSFIRDVASVADDKALTAAVIAMGHTLSLTVVAQGVETKEQADFLRQNACDEFQGFYLNKPVRAEQMEALLGEQLNIGKTESN